MKTLVVDKKFDGKHLSDVLFHTFSGLTQNLFYKTLRKKDIRVNNVRVNQDIVIHTSDEIKIYIVDDLLYKSFSLDLVYEDENIVAVNKPSGMEVVGENSLTTLFKEFLTKRQVSSTSNVFLEPCHRLDRNTTGLVLFAKNEASLKILLDSFKTQKIEKHYLATVYGIPNPASKTLTAYLFKDRKKSLVYISDEPKKGYVKIITSYTILKTNPNKNYSVLDVCLHTGRTHQIRAHLAHIGHPILGDGKYGNNQINKAFGYKVQQLCSYSLTFHFSKNASILNYLDGKTICLSQEKLFQEKD